MAFEVLRNMPLSAHIGELRRRLIRSVLGVALGGILCYAWHEEVFAFLARPVGVLVFTEPAEAMVLMMKISFLCGLLLTLPWVAYQAYGFFKPALSVQQRGMLMWGFVLAWLLFLLGVAFGLSVLPTAMRFLLGFAGPHLVAMISIGKYMSFAMLVSFGCGAVFQMPLASYFLTRMGLLSQAALLKHWRIAVMGILVFAAMICPTPDLFTWFLVTLPMFLLFGVSIWVSGLAARIRLSPATQA
jgi:sec-independent protein translocase protein TatC